MEEMLMGIKKDMLKEETRIGGGGV